MLRRGFGRHARCLLRALVEVDDRNQYTFFVDSSEAVASLPAGVRAHVVDVASPTIVAASARGPRRLRDIAAMSRALSAPNLDAVLFPTLYSYVPTFGAARRFLIIHDATAEMYPALTLGGWKNRVFWKVKTAIARRQADVLLTVSGYSRDMISRWLRVPADRLHVIGEASDPVFRVLDRPAPTRRLCELNINGSHRSIVYVGGFSPHKNVDRLIRVFDRVGRAAEFADVHLLLVGDHDRESFLSCYRSLVSLVQSLAIGSRVIFTGYLPDEDLVVLLNLATVLALPSLSEGFGLPAVEAAACGCPVVATSESPLSGLLKEGARYVDPRDEPSLERTLAEVLRSAELRGRMREAGIAAARDLSWQSAARRLRSLIDAEEPS
jgi:glycosyltransferase involved in cell wall biosynthesis